MLVRLIMIAFCLIFIIQDITKSLEFLPTNKRYSELLRERSDETQKVALYLCVRYLPNISNIRIIRGVLYTYMTYRYIVRQFHRMSFKLKGACLFP